MNLVKGQKVYLLRKNEIHETEITKLGKRWCTVRDVFCTRGEIKFDITNNYREDTVYSPDYFLYETKKEIEDIFRSRELRNTIESFIKDELYKLTIEQLEQLNKSIKVLTN